MVKKYSQDNTSFSHGKRKCSIVGQVNESQIFRVFFLSSVRIDIWLLARLEAHRFNDLSRFQVTQNVILGLLTSAPRGKTNSDGQPE
jgi:hypothetical protein